MTGAHAIRGRTSDWTLHDVKDGFGKKEAKEDERGVVAETPERCVQVKRDNGVTERRRGSELLPRLVLLLMKSVHVFIYV